MSKLTSVAGCDALASAKRGCVSTPAAAAPSTNSRRPIMITSPVENVGCSDQRRRFFTLCAPEVRLIQVQIKFFNQRSGVLNGFVDHHLHVLRSRRCRDRT